MRNLSRSANNTPESSLLSSAQLQHCALSQLRDCAQRATGSDVIPGHAERATAAPPPAAPGVRLHGYRRWEAPQVIVIIIIIILIFFFYILFSWTFKKPSSAGVLYIKKQEVKDLRQI